jgi:hypothetical protein
MSPRAKREAPRVSARDLLARVANRHSHDLWFPEVKDGPTWFGSHLRIDGLAIARTWSPVRVTGYEVKVERGDWLRDSKWEAYLAMCHVLFVVAPKDIVRLDELPQGVGLIEAAGERGLRTVRKAAYRAIDVPSDMLLYLLMSRVSVKTDEYPGMSREARVDLWRERLDGKDAARRIGRNVAKAARERIEALERSGSPRAAEYERVVEEWLGRQSPHGDTWGELGARLDAALVARETMIREETRILRRTAVRAARVLRRAGKGET